MKDFNWDDFEDEEVPKKESKGFSWDDFDSVPGLTQKQAPSIVESALRGAAQGASLGFADEITAAIESAITNKTYEKALDESRVAYKKAEEENPITSLIANMGGGLIVPVPGLGASAALKGASGLKKTYELAKMGAKAGAIAAAGTSEESLMERPRHLISDMLSGATSGAVVAPVLGQIVPHVIKKAGQAWGSTEFVQDAKKIFSAAAKEARETGADLMTREYNDELNKDLAEKIQGFSSAIIGSGDASDIAVGEKLLKAPSLAKTKNKAYDTAAEAAKDKFASLNHLDDEIAKFEKELPISEQKIGSLADELNAIKGTVERFKNVVVEDVAQGSNKEQLLSQAEKSLHEEAIRQHMKLHPKIMTEATVDAERLASKAMNSSEEALQDRAQNWVLKQKAQWETEAQNLAYQMGETNPEGSKQALQFTIDKIRNLKPTYRMSQDPQTGKRILNIEIADPFYGVKKIVSESIVVDNINKFKNLKPNTPEWQTAISDLANEMATKRIEAVAPKLQTKQVALPDGKIAVQGIWELEPGKFGQKTITVNPEAQYLSVPLATKNTANIQEIRAMKDDLNSIIKSSQNFRTKDLAVKLRNNLDKELDNLTGGLEEQAKKLQIAKTKVQALLGIDIDTNDPLKFQSQFENLTTALKNKFIDKFDQESNDIRRRLTEAFKVMYDSGFINAEGLESLYSNLGEKAKVANILKHAHETSNLATNLFNFTKWPQTARGTGYSVAGHAGVAAGAIQKSAKDFTLSVLKKSPEELVSFAKALRQMGSPFASAIDKIAQAPEAKRKAMLFTMMQNKAFRGTMESIYDSLTGADKER